MGPWVQNPITRFCESLFSLVRYPEPCVKEKQTKAATTPSQKENTTHHHTMLSSHQHNIINITRMATILSQKKAHINNTSTCHQRVQVRYPKPRIKGYMTRMAIILNQKTHKHIINTTSMVTILSQNHTSHIMHHVINTSAQHHHKHTNTTSYDQKKLERLNITH